MWVRVGLFLVSCGWAPGTWCWKRGVRVTNRNIHEVCESILSNNMDYANLKVRFNVEVQHCQELEGEVTMLRTSLHSLQGEVQDFWGLLNNVLMCLGNAKEEVRVAHLF